MIANPEKFHLMFLSANEKDLINQQTINIKGISLKSEANFTLIGIDIDNRLSFHGHINNLYRKVASQINALKRLSSFMGMTEKTILMKSFILTIAHLYGTSVVKETLLKRKRSNKELVTTMSRTMKHCFRRPKCKL